MGLLVEKFQTRTRRKTVSFFVPGKVKKVSKYFMADLENDLEEKNRKLFGEEEKRLKTFEEIYLAKQELQSK